MFDQAEQDPVLDDEAFAREEAELRTALLQQQYALLERRDRAVLFVVAGIDGAGKGSTVHLLNEWLDPRHVRTLAFGEPTPEEVGRPPMWRYWRALPPTGRIGVVFGSWYRPMLVEAGQTPPGSAALQRMAAGILRFEAMLAADGVQIVKLWFHLSRKAQSLRCERLAADPETAWRVSPEDRLVATRFACLREAGARVIALTDTPVAPWVVVPSADDNLRAVTAARVVLNTLAGAPCRPPPVRSEPPATSVVRLEGRDFSGRLPKAEYDTELAHWQARLGRAVRAEAFGKRSLAIVFEGQDAAGKGGALRRVAHALDVRQYHVVPVSAPNEIERAYPYLWRFWQQVPSPGRAVLFDRSWYGRVLVERVEKLAEPRDWRRAYEEINDFEAQWAANGTVLVKFWMAISQQEQLKRFEARKRTPFKAFKLTDEDWRNRARHKPYQRAAEEMLARTDTANAHWHVVATDDKRLARVQVVRAVAQSLEAALGVSVSDP